MVWVAIIGLLYLISLGNYLLFHTVVELFSVYVAYVIFLIVWKSRSRLENGYLIFIGGVAFFFIGSIDFLHTFTFRGGMELFPGSGINLTVQLWIAARYLESITFLLAPLFLIKRKEDVNPDVEKRYIISPDSSTFAWNVFLVYAAITILCLLSIFFFRNFPAAILKVRELLLLKF